MWASWISWIQRRPKVFLNQLTANWLSTFEKDQLTSAESSTCPTTGRRLISKLVRVHDKSLQSCLTLCDPMDCIPRLVCPWDHPGKHIGVDCHALLQGSFQPRNQTCVSCSSCIAGRFFTAEPQRKPWVSLAKTNKFIHPSHRVMNHIKAWFVLERFITQK